MATATDSRRPVGISRRIWVMTSALNTTLLGRREHLRCEYGFFVEGVLRPVSPSTPGPVARLAVQRRLADVPLVVLSTAECEAEKA